MALACSGCAYKVVRPPPLFVHLPTGDTRTVYYPAYVLVHDDQSAWDAHQIKNNIVGFFDTELLHCVDVGLDALIPGPDHHPIESGIESLKNAWAQLPDCAPVRIIGGFFSAIGIEKTTVISGIIIYDNPGDPISWFLVTRAVYLTDWIQDTLGEFNTGLGYLVPWEGSFIPAFMTAPINDAVDWMQSDVITGYIWLFHELNIGVDNFLYSCEEGYGGVVSVFVDTGVPVDQSPVQSAPASTGQP
jgi:hypothetical protein